MAEEKTGTETETKTDETTTTDEPQSTTVKSGAELTLTQADVDRIVESRLARERKKYEGHDDFKAKAEKFDELEEQNQTELEKAQKAAEKALKEKDEAVATSRGIVARSTLLQEVAKPEHKIVDPEAAVEFLLGVDKDLVELGEDGVPVNTDKAVEELLKKRAFLVTTDAPPASDADQGARGGAGNQLSEADLKTMTPEEIVKAREEGRLTNLLGGKK